MLKSSKAFSEFVSKRCEEIITEDQICSALNHKIIEVEKEIKAIMSKEQLEKFIKYADMVSELNSHCEKLTYTQGLTDRICLF